MGLKNLKPILKELAVIDNVDNDIKLSGKNFKFYKISVIDKETGEKVQPIDGKKVTIMLPIPEDYNLDNLEAIRVESDEDIEYNEHIENINGKNYLVFDTNHFSDYALYEKISNNIVSDNNYTDKYLNTSDNSLTSIILLSASTIFSGFIGIKLKKDKHE